MFGGTPAPPQGTLVCRGTPVGNHWPMQLWKLQAFLEVPDFRNSRDTRYALDYFGLLSLA